MTVGENGFGPLGIRGAFSVGFADGGVVVVAVVVVVVVVSGAFPSCFAHPADRPTKAMIAAAAAMTGWRLERGSSKLMIVSPFPHTDRDGTPGSMGINEI